MTRPTRRTDRRCAQCAWWQHDPEYHKPDRGKCRGGDPSLPPDDAPSDFFLGLFPLSHRAGWCRHWTDPTGHPDFDPERRPGSGEEGAG